MLSYNQISIAQPKAAIISTIMIPAAVPTVTTCNTCRAAFPGIDKLKEHYRGDWHAFNSKRRANELIPLSLKEFAGVISKNPAVRKSSNANPVVKPSTPSVRASTIISNDSPEGGAVATKEQIIEKRSVPQEVPESFSAVATTGGGDSIPEGEADDDGWTDATGEEEEEEALGADDLLTLKVAPNISIFDDKEFPNIVACVNYMEQKFGFFIPDIECLVDLPGLLVYLGEKVKLGGVCLYCHKQLQHGRPCQNHMISKSHCKIAYDEEVDLDEFEAFYDYSLGYGSDEDGEEDMEDLEVSAVGELILPNKTVGHRSYVRYYKQNLKREDTRPSVLAVKREEVIKMGNMFGSMQMDESSVMKLSDVAVAAVLAQQKKEMLKTTRLQQRAEQRHVYRTQRRGEYQSTVDKLRSSATTTDKIRDWHGLL